MELARVVVPTLLTRYSRKEFGISRAVAGARVRRRLLMSRFVSRDNRWAASAACGRVERSSAAVSESAVGTRRAHRDAAYSA